MSNWYVDKGLATLIAQVKKKFPGIVVGTIGDTAHQAEHSDHNPEADGSVDAADFMLGKHFTEENAQWLVNTLVHFKDPRIAYIIWNGRIISSTKQNGKAAWTWRVYTGSNPHRDHPHVSVNDKHETDASPWRLVIPTKEINVALTIDQAVALTPFSSGGGSHSPIGDAVLNSSYPKIPGASRTPAWSNFQDLQESVNALADKVTAVTLALSQINGLLDTLTADPVSGDNVIVNAVRYANANP